MAGRVALVTGGGQGIGRAICLAFAQGGAKVIVADINEQTGREVVQEIHTQGGHGHFVRVDVTDSASVQAMVQATVAQFGRLDVAVNNAAIRPEFTKIADLNETQWMKILQTNLTSVAFCLKWELQEMLAQGNGGSVVNFTAGSALRPQPMMAAYVAAKSGVIGLTKVAAAENGAHRIRVNCVSPGATSTAMMYEALSLMGTTEEECASHTGYFGRLASPQEIANAVVWLVSDQASYVTGVVLPVDAGFAV